MVLVGCCYHIAWGDVATWLIFVVTAIYSIFTIALWRSQQKANRQTREHFELLNKATVYVQSIRARPVPESNEIDIDIIIKNGGNLIANGRVLIVAGSFDRNALLQAKEINPESLMVFPQSDTVKTVRMNDEERDHLTEGNHYYVLVRLTYEHGTREKWQYELLSRWDAVSDRPIREEESVKPITN